MRIGPPVAPPAAYDGGPGGGDPEGGDPTGGGADARSDAAVGPDIKVRSDWSCAIELRDTVRAWMLAHCGEPDLANRNPLRDLIERRTGSGGPGS